MCERRVGQWSLVFAVLIALAAFWAMRQTEAVLLAGGLLAVVAIADRRPSGVPFHPAEDTLDLALALSGWLLRLMASPNPDGSSHISRRR